MTLASRWAPHWTRTANRSLGAALREDAIQHLSHFQNSDFISF